jgi:Fic family protein
VTGASWSRGRERLGRDSGRVGSVLQIYELMRTTPCLTAIVAAERSGLTMPTVNAAFAQLHKLEIVQEVTGRRRDRVYAYRAYLDILGEGAEPPTIGG